MLLRAAYWTSFAIFAGLVLAKFDSRTGFTSLIRFGEFWETRRHPALIDEPIAVARGSYGYDGQFYAQIALDPLLRDPATSDVIDAPVYRARRILLPGTAFLLGMGDPKWILQAFALLNVACWFLLAWQLQVLIPIRDWTAFARWAGCLFSMGALESVRQSLVDLPAMLLLVFGIREWERRNVSRSVLWLTLGHLTKETSVLASFALLAQPPLRRGPWLSRAKLLLVSLLPLALWLLYLHSRLPSAAGGSGIGNFSWPFHGMLSLLRDSFTAVGQGNFDGRYLGGIFAATSFVLQAAVLCRARKPSDPWWRIGVAYALLLVFLGPWVWSGYWAACRALLPLTFAFNFLVPASRTFWAVWLLGNLTMGHAIWRFL